MAAQTLTICSQCGESADAAAVRCSRCGASLSTGLAFGRSAIGLGDGDETGPGLPTDADAARLSMPSATNRATPPAAVPHAVAESAGELVGQSLGTRYQIQRLLGIGGMGAVYAAWDRELGVVVALKTVRPEIASDP